MSEDPTALALARVLTDAIADHLPRPADRNGADLSPMPVGWLNPPLGNPENRADA